MFGCCMQVTFEIEKKKCLDAVEWYYVHVFSLTFSEWVYCPHYKAVTFLLKHRMFFFFC